MKQPIVDLRRESECNGVENYVAIEAMEVGRQRAEAAQWTFQRIKNSLDNQQTSLSGNSVFKHTSLPWKPFLIQQSWLSVLLLLDICAAIICHNDWLSSSLSWFYSLLTDSEVLFILFAVINQIILKIHLIPLLLTFMYLVKSIRFKTVSALSLLYENNILFTKPFQASSTCH